MDSTKKTITEITLILSEDEARWLKGLMQNPIIGDESSKDGEICRLFWDELTHQGVKI